MAQMWRVQFGVQPDTTDPLKAMAGWRDPVISGRLGQGPEGHGRVERSHDLRKVRGGEIPWSQES